ncbi:MAG: zinc finger/helix-turn-helix protein [Peptococcaceae bacterium BRH_c4b]|nr:MAG: zinc finger/helix-turn-helix protein [Peptococcaceae bacterium BRH_c4b]
MIGFCEKCHDMVEYSVKEEKKTKIIKGKEIKYTGRVAFCSECEDELFVADVRDYNLQMLDIAFREQEKLISVSEIESILERYKIGKRPLSLLLGWGEVTVTRYLNRDIPTKQYSETLKKILYDPNYMAEILEKNKEKITTHAYTVCKQALEKIDNGTVQKTFELENEGKIDSFVKYLLNNCAEVTPLALQKLLYYVQGFYKAFQGEYLFKDDCEAWVHGPVYRNIYYKYKDHGYNPIEESNVNYGEINLSMPEKEIIDSVITNFACYSGKVLEKMTHIETPWRVTRRGLGDNEVSDMIINKELIANYFVGIKSKYNMLNISDIRDYSTDLFKKLF